MTEEQHLLAKIGQLAGQINRHKNQSSQSPAPNSSQFQSGHYASRHVTPRAERPGWAPYRGRHHARGRAVAPHRHRTLVLNNAASAGATPSSTSSPGPVTDNDGEARSTPSTSGWVAKRDRHMQLINSAVYDKETQARTKAMEESRKLKAQKKAQREEAKVLSYAQGVSRQYPPSSVPSASTVAQPSAGYQIFFNDIPFRIAQGGSKLIRVSSATPFDASSISRAGLPLVDDPNTATNTPKRVTVAGVTFVRSKNGNLHRLGAETQRDSQEKRTLQKILYDGYRYFPSNRLTYSTCYKGPSCLYVHDPNKVAICKDFVQTGKCAAGLSCDLSHEPSSHRSPTCMHFLRGRCANPECRYAHIRVTPGAPVCREFATLGYCERGDECDQRHVHECPDYANTGVCNKKRCHLPHVDRAGQMKNAASKADNNEEESDASSEEEEYDAIDSDDVDSDEFDDEPEFIIEGTGNGELLQQQDFVRF
ncbi:hypothetical protein MW887_006432 [Aspergillus wentii]|nr:hypothetical protein MW887_006432 [Aspergillus wentii]